MNPLDLFNVVVWASCVVLIIAIIVLWPHGEQLNPRAVLLNAYAQEYCGCDVFTCLLVYLGAVSFVYYALTSQPLTK